MNFIILWILGLKQLDYKPCNVQIIPSKILFIMCVEEQFPCSRSQLLAMWTSLVGMICMIGMVGTMVG